MVKVCHAAAALSLEEMESDAEAREVTRRAPADQTSIAQSAPTSGAAPQARVSTMRRPLALAQGTGADFTPGAARQIGDVTRSTLNAVSFPRFVGELINGVFKAMLDSSAQQMNSYVELLNNVASSVDGFADSNMGPDRARAWLAERYPGSFEIVGESAEDAKDRDPDEPPPQASLRLRPGASMPSQEALRNDLGLGEGESAPTGDPESLAPFVRRRLSQMRQGMLATMVMLGMQRIVIESGRITAAMRFHIDTRSAAQEDRASRFDFRNQANAAGSFGAGPWGVSASMSNTVGYVNTQRSTSTEEMNTDLDLNSSVEINFKSDYLPLNRMTSPGQAERIRGNTLNPEAEAAAAAAARSTRVNNARTGEAARVERLNQDLTPTEPAKVAPGDPGSVEHADSLRENRAKEPNRSISSQPAKTPSNPTAANPAPPSPPPANSGAPPSPPASNPGKITGSVTAGANITPGSATGSPGTITGSITASAKIT
jgi:hypothetical protein